MNMGILIVFNRQPYDGTDVTWNGLRLCGALRKAGEEVRIFLMNDAVDMARDANTPPEGYDQDLSQMLRDLIAGGAPVKVCGTCMARCGIYRNQPYFEGAEKSTMAALAEWVTDSDKVLTFCPERAAHGRERATEGAAHPSADVLTRRDRGTPGRSPGPV
jgi:uncharacterized protein involved in oxidation of intracellular sulfur